MEQTTGIEPATSGLLVRRSTTELGPQTVFLVRGIRTRRRQGRLAREERKTPSVDIPHRLNDREGAFIRVMEKVQAENGTHTFP